MHPDLRSAFQNLDRQKDAFVAEVARLTPEQQGFHPDPDAWSAAQVVDHLARSEEAVVKSLRKGLPDGARKRTLKDRVAYYLVLGFMASPLRIKAPLPSIVPPEVGFDEANARWGSARHDLHTELAAVDDVDEPVIVHPVAGPAGARRTLHFLAAHVGHHERQLRRIQGHRSFPA